MELSLAGSTVWDLFYCSKVQLQQRSNDVLEWTGPPGLGKVQTSTNQNAPDSNSVNPPASLLWPSETQQHPPCLLQIHQSNRGGRLGSDSRTLLIPQLTKEPLPGFVGRSSTTPSRYSESSSTRMWWGLSRGLRSPRMKAAAKERTPSAGTPVPPGAAAPSLSGLAHHSASSAL